MATATRYSTPVRASYPRTLACHKGTATVPATPEEIAAHFGNLVLRYGYRRASVDDVARDLRLSKQTIYGHFATKADLYRASVELWATQQRARVELALKATTALGRLTEVITIALADARASMTSHPFGDATEPPEIIQEVNAQVFGPMVCDLIEQGNKTGEFAVEDPELIAAFAVSVGMEAVRLMAEDDSGRVERAAHEAIRRMIAGALPQEGER